MSAPVLLLELHAAGRRFYAPHDQISGLGLLDGAAPPALDARGLPVLVRSLAALLDPAAVGGQAPRQALMVRLRRRAVALLVDRVERLADNLQVQQLAPLLQRRLAMPWVIGAVAAEPGPVLVLDLRRIAADVALGVV